MMPIIGTAFMLTACPKKVEIPEFHPPAFPDFEILKAKRACSKPESTQNIAAAALKSATLITDRVESQDIQYLNCDGKVVAKKHGPVRPVHKVLSVEAPRGNPEGLSYIEVENTRTCSIYRVDVKEDRAPQDRFEMTDGRKIRINSPLTKIDQSGVVKLSLTD